MKKRIDIFEILKLDSQKKTSKFEILEILYSFKNLTFCKIQNTNTKLKSRYVVPYWTAYSTLASKWEPILVFCASISTLNPYFLESPFSREKLATLFDSHLFKKTLLGRTKDRSCSVSHLRRGSVRARTTN